MYIFSQVGYNTIREIENMLQFQREEEEESIDIGNSSGFVTPKCDHEDWFQSLFTE